jgi:hypothetical protein
MASEPNQEELCFVIGPIGDPDTDVRRHADWLLHGIIEPIFADHFPNFRVQRADHMVSPGSISFQVIGQLMHARLVIADMSFNNANAFYELAIRHAMQLPTIHMILKGSTIPFDLAHLRAIFFSTEWPEHVASAKTQLKATVEEVMQPGFQVDNPITHAKVLFALREQATPEVRALIDEVTALRGRLDGLGGRLDGLERSISSNRGAASTAIYALTGYPTGLTGVSSFGAAGDLSGRPSLPLGVSAFGVAGDLSGRPLPPRGLGAHEVHGEKFEPPFAPEDKKKRNDE